MYQYQPEKPKKDNFYSALVYNASVTYYKESGKLYTAEFGRGIFRIYKDLPRIEFKDENGVITAFMWDVVRSYTYKQVPKFDDIPEIV